MNAPFERGHLRLLEDVLGEDAYERPSREEVEAIWRAARQVPVPRYHDLRRLVIRGRP